MVECRDRYVELRDRILELEKVEVQQEVLGIFRLKDGFYVVDEPMGDAVVLKKRSVVGMAVVGLVVGSVLSRVLF